VMSRHLPEWLSIRPAGQQSFFARGELITRPSASLASR